jgi:hypothetical protein
MITYKEARLGIDKEYNADCPPSTHSEPFAVAAIGDLSELTTQLDCWRTLDAQTTLKRDRFRHPSRRLAFTALTPQTSSSRVDPFTRLPHLDVRFRSGCQLVR